MTTDPASDFVPEWTDGDKLRKVRRHLRLSQEEFAERLQVNPSTYMAWEADRNRVKDMRAIAKRIKAMAGTPLWWWFDTERPDGGNGGPDGGGVRPKGFEPLTFWLGVDSPDQGGKLIEADFGRKRRDNGDPGKVA